jgi:hypothetical protein
MTVTPRDARSSTFACVAAWRYMRLFMAGATATGQAAASAAVVTRLSAWPVASLAIVFAVAGAIRYTSARSTSARWLMGARSGTGSPGYEPRAGSGSNSLLSTGAPVNASNDVFPTNRSLAGVWITRTAWPALTARRAVSRALYAAIPPLTPMSNRDMPPPDRAPTGSGT